MTTKSDLVEANAFMRRRLVAAFVSGAPGDHEAQPHRPSRSIFVGLALAVLLVAGAAITSVIRPPTAESWDGAGVVVSRDTGERYLVASDGGKPRPLLNLTSAQLVLGMRYKLTVVSQRAFDAHAPGAEMGILGAPPELPPQSAFLASGWTACTAAGAGIALDVSAAPPVTPLRGRGLVVRAGQRDYLVADGSDGVAHAFRIASALDAQALFSSASIVRPAIRVPRAWLALLGRVVSLRSPGGLGAIRTSAGYAAVRSWRGRSEAMTIGPFAAHLIAHGEPQRRPLPARTLSNEHLLDPSSYAAWPDQLVEATRTESVCAQLRPSTAGHPSAAALVAPTGEAAWPTRPPEVHDRPVVRVDPGRGAFVRSAAAPGSTFMITSTGRKYRLTDPASLDTLGLTTYAAPLVDPHWLALFPEGPELLRRTALGRPGIPAGPVFRSGKPGPQQGPGRPGSPERSHGGAGGIRTPEGY